MWNCFTGRKRKAGVVTLTVACILAVAWIRSRSHLDLLVVNLPIAQFILISSAEGIVFSPLGLRILFQHERTIVSAGASQVVKVTQVLSATASAPLLIYSREASGRVLFDLPLGTRRPSHPVHHAWVVGPLTVISAWLLLTTSRRKKPDSHVADKVV